MKKYYSIVALLVLLAGLSWPRDSVASKEVTILFSGDIRGYITPVAG